MMTQGKSGPTYETGKQLLVHIHSKSHGSLSTDVNATETKGASRKM